MRILLSMLFTAVMMALQLGTHRPTPSTLGDLPTNELLAAIPAPHAAGSIDAIRDLDAVRVAQANATADDQRRAYDESLVTVFSFDNVVGSGFSAAECPKTARLFQDIDAKIDRVLATAHERWHQSAPQAADVTLLQTASEDLGQYPASPAVRATVFAQLLAEAMPEHRDELTQRSQQIASDSILAGAQVPSDVTAGETLGNSIAGRLLESPDMRTQLAVIRAELSSVALNK